MLWSDRAADRPSARLRAAQRGVRRVGWLLAAVALLAILTTTLTPS